jgi:hypothetical protein
MPDGVVVSLNEARTMREYAKAKLTELELGKRVGELVQVSEVKNIVMTATRAARDLLESIPDRLAEMLVNQPDPEEIRRLIRVEIHHALDELAVLQHVSEAEAAENERVRAVWWISIGRGSSHSPAALPATSCRRALQVSCWTCPTTPACPRIGSTIGSALSSRTRYT